MNTSEIDCREPIMTYGLDSIVAFNITGDIAAWLNRDLDATLLWEYPTIEAVSEYLASQDTARDGEVP